MSETLYCYVVNGVITESHITLTHIVNRGHSVSMYTPCVYKSKPIISMFEVAKESLVVGKDETGSQVVFVEYHSTPLSLEDLLDYLPTNNANATPEDIAAGPAPELVKRIQQLFVYRVQDLLDNFARTRNYDSILAACTYATSEVEKFRIEGQTAVNLRDRTWAALYTFSAELTEGIRPFPKTFDDVIEALPVLEWTN